MLEEMLSCIICEAPKKFSTIFKPFLVIFTLFHLKNWPYLQKPEFGNLAKTRFWFLLVNNSLCSIPLSCARSYIKETPGDRCVYSHKFLYLFLSNSYCIVCEFYLLFVVCDLIKWTLNRQYWISWQFIACLRKLNKEGTV